MVALRNADRKVVGSNPASHVGVVGPDRLLPRVDDDDDDDDDVVLYSAVTPCYCSSDQDLNVRESTQGGGLCSC